VAGILPVRLFAPRCRSLSCCKFPRSEGTFPLN